MVVGCFRITTRKARELRVSIDLTRCAGYGNCVDAAEAVFEMSDVDDIAVVLLAEPGPDLWESVRKAARVCPANAIVIDEADE
ncbi:ferredoxin [Longivirga aurantiaca]|uniref:Ferredoxin n=1 Tax=Longivirga aurantiaca TaxID=1837743 RepID=A0ABW1SWD2_9ACTN